MIQKSSSETLLSEGPVWSETVPLKEGTQNSLKDLTMKFPWSCLHIDDVYHPLLARFSRGMCPVFPTPQLKSWENENQVWKARSQRENVTTRTHTNSYSTPSTIHTLPLFLHVWLCAWVHLYRKARGQLWMTFLISSIPISLSRQHFLGARCSLVILHRPACKPQGVSWLVFGF